MRRLSLTIFVLPKQLYLYALGYLIATIILHWRLTIDLSLVWYLLGALIGLHLLPVWEYFVFGAPAPLIAAVTPLRSVLVVLLMSVLTFFVITSTKSMFGAGLVLFLSLFLTYIQFQAYKRGELTRWWGNGKPPAPNTLNYYLWAILGVFLFNTILFSI